MDIFVLPSLSEGIPMALLEAMALGRPVVATAVGGIPEIVTHTSNGLLIEPGDEQGLANACLDLAFDRTRAQAIGAAARETIEEAFSHEASGRAVVDAYREVVSGPATPAPGRPYNLDTWTLCRELARGLLAYGWRRISHPIQTRIERRRMNWIRRHPADLTAALRAAQRILIVCHGNIIRSPFAARLIAQTLRSRARVSIASAGLEAVPGKPPHSTALEVATSRGVDLTGHTASPLTAEIVAASDAIFVMEADHLITMRKRFPAARAKTFLLTCLAADTPLEIQDPFAGDEPQFRACFDHISRAVDSIVLALPLQ
jgi:protein-tyrosine-phosphatase